jgi:hypothetical protein
MPTNRRRRWLPRTAATLTQCGRALLEDGAYPDAELLDVARGDDYVQLVLARRPDREEGRDLWDGHRTEILSAWLMKNPGRRPWAWWKFEATEPRRLLVDGAPLVPPPPWLVNSWPVAFGVIPMHHLEAVRTADVVELESQAGYLRRLGLLTAAERARLTEADYAWERLADESGGEFSHRGAPTGVRPSAAPSSLTIHSLHSLTIHSLHEEAVGDGQHRESDLDTGADAF